MNNPKITSVSEAINDLEFKAKFDRIFEYCQKREGLFSKWLSENPPQDVRCKIHGDVALEFNQRASLDSDRGNQFAWSLVYDPCHACDEESHLLKSGVPAVLKHARFENFSPASDKEAEHMMTVKDFASKRMGFLVLRGNFGTGKTHLAVSAMRSFRKAVFIKQSSLLLLLRQTYRDRSAADPVELCQKASLLVLDEVGLSAGGKDELPLLHEILDNRYGARKPTIITCNVEVDQLKSTIGERMVDRLSECCFGVLVFGGSSHRREAKGRYFNSRELSDKPEAHYWWEERYEPNI